MDFAHILGPLRPTRRSSEGTKLLNDRRLILCHSEAFASDGIGEYEADYHGSGPIHCSLCTMRR
jgi:hypothetical protein